jgi:hypothetical protein
VLNPGNLSHPRPLFWAYLNIPRTSKSATAVSITSLHFTVALWQSLLVIHNRPRTILQQAAPRSLRPGLIDPSGSSRSFQDRIVKTVNVRRDALRDVYVTFSCDEVPKPEPAPKTGQSAGADFGLKDFLTLSTGEKIAAPLPLKAELRHLRKAQRVLSRKQKGSKARKRASLDVARVHKKVANVRSDWQWKQARLLVTVFDLLVFETLKHQSDAPTLGEEGGRFRIR